MNKESLVPKNEEESTHNIGYWEQVLEAPTPAYAELFEAEQQFLLQGIPHDATVLDIGCGEGRNMRNILLNTPYVTGVDSDKVAVKDAQKHFEHIPTVQLVQADAVRLPFADNTYDIVTFLMILPNLDQQKVSALQESHRVLKEGGKLLLSTFAETALKDRMEIYQKVHAPITQVVGTKVIFDESLGANVSEQFTLEELAQLGDDAGLTLLACEKVGAIAYLCTYQK